jgi:uncharacterized protein (DUF433 family)
MIREIVIDTEITRRKRLFVGARVPARSLFVFVHEEGGESIEDFLERFRSVKRNQVLAMLEESEVHPSEGV